VGETVSFQMSGPLTIREQTNMVTFDVTAVWQEKSISGTATADIQLSDFGLAPPNLLGILTVSKHVMLVLDFHLQGEDG
jgi:polyisoprenoid-binding protein YceI